MMRKKLMDEDGMNSEDEIIAEERNSTISIVD